MAVVPEHALPCSHDVPLAEQVSGTPELHIPAPGVHNVHTPALHTGVVPVHTAPLLWYIPFTHVTGCWPLQAASPGLHVPWHEALPALEMHVEPAHGCGVPYSPLDVQVATPLFMHSCWPGAHPPTHAPPTHAVFMQVTIAVHGDSVPSGRHTRCAVHRLAGAAPPSGAV
jgi:hypothetical protein